MALDGGGGGGGPVGAGNSFTGAAEALEVAGPFGYAYSGAVTVTSGGYTPALDFTTGNFYAILDLQVWTADVSGSDLFYKVEMNGTVIVEQGNNNPVGSGAAGMETPIILHVPPYTEIVVSGQRGSGSDYDVYFNLTGRLYRD